VLPGPSRLVGLAPEGHPVGVGLGALFALFDQLPFPHVQILQPGLDLEGLGLRQGGICFCLQPLGLLANRGPGAGDLLSGLGIHGQSPRYPLESSIFEIMNDFQLRFGWERHLYALVFPISIPGSSLHRIPFSSFLFDCQNNSDKMKMAWLYKRITETLDSDCFALEGLTLLIVPWAFSSFP
jgi:hypothetical protein